MSSTDSRTAPRTQHPTDYTGRTVVVAGGTSGMGRAVAAQAAALGATVHIIGRDRTRAAGVATELSAAARSAGAGPADAVTGHGCDLSDGDAVRALVGTLGAIDHLVVTAASLTYGPFTDLTAADLHGVFDGKLLGAFEIVRAAVPALTDDASVVLVGGLADERPGAGTTLVSAVNGAITALGRALAVELAPVRVNVVSPGVTDSPSWAHLSDDEREDLFEQTAASLPVGRVGRPEDIADAVLFLLTAGFITAETLHVDGGGRVA